MSVPYEFLKERMEFNFGLKVELQPALGCLGLRKQGRNSS